METKDHFCCFYCSLLSLPLAGVSIFIPKGTVLTKVLFPPQGPSWHVNVLGDSYYLAAGTVGRDDCEDCDSGAQHRTAPGTVSPQAVTSSSGNSSGHRTHGCQPVAGGTRLPPPTLALSPLCAARAAPHPPPPGDHDAPLPSQLRKQVLRKTCFLRNVDAGCAFSLPKVLGSRTLGSPLPTVYSPATPEPSDGPPASGHRRPWMEKPGVCA